MARFEIGENLGYLIFVFLMVILVIFAGVLDKDTPRFKAVVIEVSETNKTPDKVKFIEDQTIDLRNIEKGFAVGDTILLIK